MTESTVLPKDRFSWSKNWRSEGERRKRTPCIDTRPQRSPKAVMETDIDERTPILPRYCRRRGVSRFFFSRSRGEEELTLM